MSSTSDAPLVAEQFGSILRIDLARDEKRNALNAATVLGIADLMQTLPESVKCVVIAARGTHFSAGLDLSELVVRSSFETVQHSRLWHRCLDHVQFSGVPVVSALHGAVIGGGLELAASTHIRVADETSYYALPEAARGIFVGGGGSARLPRLIGVARMTDMMLTGRVLTAQEGHAAGISQYLVPAGQADEVAMQLAEKIAGNTPFTNYAVSSVLPRIADASQDVGLQTEAIIASLVQTDPEVKGRLEDFLDGRVSKVQPGSAGQSS